MAVGLAEPENLLPIEGIRLACTNANIKRNKKNQNDDLVLIEICQGATVAATFTQNKFCAAPVYIARDHLAAHPVRYLLINSGNANAGTGRQGLLDTQICCQRVADLGHCDPQSVLPFSTGVIGEHLPVEKIAGALPLLFGLLQVDAWNSAAIAIMTTDTLAKGCSRKIKTADGVVTITGIAKGSGMIHPNMATMLAYIATDAKFDVDVLKEIHTGLVNKTFNRITVDGDTSTNDACVLIATGKSEVQLKQKTELFELFVNSLFDVYMQLAHAIIRDGEGATKFIKLEVVGGLSEAECLQVANTVALSPLVKTALFASDANWGRIVAAIGRAGLTDFDVSKLNLTINGVSIMRNGDIDATYTEHAGSTMMQQSEINIFIDLARGVASESVWTCDFSNDYVRINAGYRS